MKRLRVSVAGLMALVVYATVGCSLAAVTIALLGPKSVHLIGVQNKRRGQEDVVVEAT